ncbi:MAG: hypothetical protein EGR71_07730 [Clostridiales bacterium]|nr:hypothetical protein [Clostridiales bacterium]
MPFSMICSILGGFFMEEETYEIIQKQLGYQFKNTDLLQQAFVRRSYAKENGGADNEVLELIGDRALDMIVMKILIEEYGYMASECDEYDSDECDEFYSEKNEGQLTELKRKIVQGQSLTRRIDELGWAEYLILGNGDIKNHIYDRPSVKEDLFEAVIGAVVIDSNWNYGQLEDVISYVLNIEAMINSDSSDNYVAMVQDWYVKKYKEYPVFECTNVEYSEYNKYCCDYNMVWPGNRYSYRTYCTGTYWANRNMPREVVVKKPKKSYSGLLFYQQSYSEFFDTHFKCEIELLDKKFIAFDESKTGARKEVCNLIYEYLVENNLLYTIQDEIENPTKGQAINQLETLARRGYFSIPTYKYREKYDDNGNPIWYVECFVKEKEYSFFAEKSTKKEAKKQAAYDMLRYVLGMQN